jgi:hypothetical protein
MAQPTPLIFGMQGPWKNPVDNTTSEEKVILNGNLSFPIKPKSRLILTFKIGEGNSVAFNIPGRQFDEVYDIIDGYVEEEFTIDDRVSPLQRGSVSYVNKYTTHAGGNIMLDREIMMDLEAYPLRDSYSENNIILELIEAVREDAHDKEMDARSIYVRFDTRFVSESVHSYYDKFFRLPTALTCDLLPNEAVISIMHGSADSLYKNLHTEIHGSSLVAQEGKIRLSFDNPTDEEMVLTPAFSNSRMYYDVDDGYGTFKMNNIFELFRDDLLFQGDEENCLGRQKLGIKFTNTEAQGE